MGHRPAAGNTRRSLAAHTRTAGYRRAGLAAGVRPSHSRAAGSTWAAEEVRRKSRAVPGVDIHIDPGGSRVLELRVDRAVPVGSRARQHRGDTHQGFGGMRWDPAAAHRASAALGRAAVVGLEPRVVEDLGKDLQAVAAAALGVAAVAAAEQEHRIGLHQPS
jgi:hypothetical protein